MKKSFFRSALLVALVALAGCGSATSNAAPQTAAAPTLAASATPTRACVPGSSGQTAAAPAAPPSLYLSSEDGFVYALNGPDGSARWKFDLGGNGKASYTGPLALDHNILYVSASNDVVYALNASDGTLRWRVDCPLDGLGLVAPVVSSGIVYVAGAETLYALRASDGKEIWHQKIGNEDILPFAVDGTMVYVNARDATSGNGLIEALSAATGAQRWSVPVGSAQYALPLAADGSVYVSESSSGGPGSDLYAFNGSDGAQRWHLQQNDLVLSLALSQGLIYGLFASGSLLAVNAADGTQRWQVPAPATVLTAANGTLYLAAPGIVNPTTVSPNGMIAALSADTGAQRWSASIQSGPCGCTTGGLAFLRPSSGGTGISPPVVFNGMVALWLGGVISTLDAGTGKALWQTTVGSDYQAFLVAG